MRKISLIFGLFSGVVSAGLLIATIPYVNSVNYRTGDLLGYTSIALSAQLVFLGVRSYRENSSGGRLGLGRGLAVGLLRGKDRWLTVVSLEGPSEVELLLEPMGFDRSKDLPKGAV